MSSATAPTPDRIHEVVTNPTTDSTTTSSTSPGISPFPSMNEIQSEVSKISSSTDTPSSSLESSPAVSAAGSSTGLSRKARVSSLSLSDMSRLARARSGSRSLSRSISRRRSRRASSAVRQRKTIIDHERVAGYAFAFDIDGVIVKGPDTIPQAKEAIKLLNGDNKYNIRIPYIFVTNGGGRSEQARCAELSKRLEVELDAGQVIQGHTPMRDLVNVHSTVLVIGGVGDNCRKVAEEYGFKDIVTPLDVMKWNPSVTPYHTLTEEELAFAQERDFSKINVEAILVFADSRNWAADQQIILELLMSKNGRMGTVSETFDEGPQIYFAHSDFVWATNYGLSRYGMGALQVSLGALYKAHTGKELKMIKFGKPQHDTFKFAEKVLMNWRKETLEDYEEDHPYDEEDPEFKELQGEEEEEFSEEEEDEDGEPLSLQNLAAMTLEYELPPASTVYFVGDTPESDIRFANSHDDTWFSILVKTGVYQDGTEPKFKPKHLCNDVLEAVKFAIEREHEKELEEWNKSVGGGPVEFFPSELTMTSSVPR